MGSIGMPEILLIFLVVLLVFGAKRIPEIARGLGKGIREFKDATTDIKRELTIEDNHRINAPRQGNPQPYVNTYQEAAPATPAQQPAQQATASGNTAEPHA